jgi:hypothetical protein
MDEPFRVMIETAFRRDLGPGVPVQASLLPAVNPITFAINLIGSIPVGIDNALEELGVGRTLGTTASGPYGVGGPPLPAPPMSTATTLSSSTTTERVSPQVDSDEQSAEPAAAEAATPDNDDTKTVSARRDTTPATSTAKPKVKPDPPTKEPEQPTVRGPIELDSQKIVTESDPTSESDSTSESTSTTTSDSVSSTESANKDAA